MKNTKTVFYLGVDREGIFDASLEGQKVAVNNKLKHLKKTNKLLFNKGAYVRIDGGKEVKSLESFTLEAIINAKSLNKRMNIAESQQPPVAFFIDTGGILTARVYVKNKWQKISANTPLSANKEHFVRFVKDKNRILLEIDGKEVGSKALTGSLKEVGSKSFFIGTGVDGKSHPFMGNIADFRIRKGCVTRKLENKIRKQENVFITDIKRKFDLARVDVILDPDYSYARLQPVKNILSAVGVQSLSELSTLKIDSPVLMTPGKVLIAPEKTNSSVSINWGEIAKKVHGLSKKEKQLIMAKNLLNRNSVKIIKKETTMPDGGGAGPVSGHGPGIITGAGGLAGNVSVVSIGTGMSGFKVHEIKKHGIFSKHESKINLSHVLDLKKDKLSLTNTSVLENL